MIPIRHTPLPLRLILSCLFLLCLFPPTSGAPALAGNPFISGKPAPSREVPALRGPSFLRPALARIVLWQMALRQRMSVFAQDVKDRPLGRSFWLFIALSFAYGVIHALGPGHGKLLAASYFLNRPGRLARGLLFGVLSMLFHVLSATVLVLAGWKLLQLSAAGAVENYGGRLETVSYALLLGLGLVLLGRTLWELRQGPADETPNLSRAGRERWGLLGMTLAAGLVPCPGASMVLIFAISLDILPAGLLAMLCVSLGMGLTISACAMATILSRGFLLRLMRTRRTLQRNAHLGLSLAGALLVASLGGVLLLGRLAG